MELQDKFAIFKESNLLKTEKIVFLDLCHWYRLLEEKRYERLMRTLTSQVEDGKVICPVSFSIINEFQKHKDKDLVLKRIRFADRLSKRFAIIHYRRLPRIEFVKYSNDSCALEKYDALTHWFDFFPEELRFEQNGATDEQYDVLCSQLLAMSPDIWLKYDEFWRMTETLDKEVYGRLRSLVNDGHYIGKGRKLIEKEEMDFLIDLLLSELIAIKNFKAEELDAIRNFHEKTAKTSEGRRSFFRNLPSLFMRSKINTSLRYDKKTVKVNDFWDLEHAMALPYSHIYVTDKPTAHTLKNTLKLESKFGVSILNSLDDLEFFINNVDVN
ncbi:hypothetical protein PVT67_11460 [Gallaecimonas kandeliae]|uniref:hypothetical protein n=1 Tax=Gallaecimonas kandeliae TaxID=3029055 RepID=UPI00264771C6|nr:hypothetical protein [Gallaecimonas kandeliae]WKE64297.1 hypothetical protein PVT67_11460 [Gallaecimonas kandeliae]